VATIAPATTAPTSLAPAPPPRVPVPANPPLPAGSDTWQVAAGDSFWSIAEEVLTDFHGTPPAQHQLIRYWRQLMAANHDRLPVPTNPDLLVPGQPLVLPAPA